MAPLPKLAPSPTPAVSAPILPPDPPPTPRPAFPIAALGPRIAAAATATAARGQAPVDLAAHHLLTLAALAAQRLVSVRLPTGALRPVSCYFVTLVGTGEGRGALTKAIVDPARDAAGADAVFRLRLFHDAHAPGGSDRYRAFRFQSALFAERSEAVIAPLRARRAEAASLADLWDGRVEKTSVFTGPSYPRFSFHLVATPRDGRAMRGDPLLADAGRLGRVLVAAPPSLIGARVWAARHDDAPPELAAVHDHLKTLLAREAAAESRAVTFTESAAAAWFAFAQEMEVGMREEGAFARIRPLAGRLAEHAARLAAVTALMEDEAAAILDEPALARGIALARFYAAEALRGLADLPLRATPAEITLQLQLWLERTHADRTVTLREVCRSGPPCVRDADLAYKHMRRLERLGVVRPKALMPESAGGARCLGVSYAWHVGLHAAPANSPCPSQGVA